jgi:hypothetical protein
MGLRTPRWAHRCSGDRSESRRATRQGALPGSVVLGRRAISTLVAADRGVRWSGLMDCRRGRRQLERRRLQLDWRLCGVLYRRVRSGDHEPLMHVGVAHRCGGAPSCPRISMISDVSWVAPPTRPCTWIGHLLLRACQLLSTVHVRHGMGDLDDARQRRHVTHLMQGPVRDGVRKQRTGREHHPGDAHLPHRVDPPPEGCFFDQVYRCAWLCDNHSPHLLAPGRFTTAQQRAE